jgi:hypothetical protein
MSHGISVGIRCLNAYQLHQRSIGKCSHCSKAGIGNLCLIKKCNYKFATLKAAKANIKKEKTCKLN